MSKVLKFSDVVIEDLSYENPNNESFEYLASETTGNLVFQLPEMKVYSEVYIKILYIILIYYWQK